MILYKIVNKFNLQKKVKLFAKTSVQRLFITIELYLENGLANHAAAGAYGFLLSIAPMLLLLVFFILVVFKPSPHIIAGLIDNIPFIEVVSDENWLSRFFLTASGPGVSGIISVLSILWAGRILVLAIQRGLKIIFTGTKIRNPLIDALITVAVEAFILLYILILILGSRTVIYFFQVLNIIHESPAILIFLSKISSRIFPVAALGIISLFTYLFIPANSPRKLSAFYGAALCTIVYSFAAFSLDILINLSRYDFLYGAMGNLIILLVNVYFFFIFFFLGAQYAFVIDSFDALLFLKVRHSREKPASSWFPDITKKLFFSIDGKLKKYLQTYKKDETIFLPGDLGKDIYYILEGEVGIIISSVLEPETVKQGTFFGESGYLLAESRTETAIAKTDVSVLALPPYIFEEIIKIDTNLDRAIIEHLSHWLKNSNKQIAALSSRY
jgi:membrane protein